MVIGTSVGYLMCWGFVGDVVDVIGLQKSAGEEFANKVEILYWG